jgi:hypothetical protein
MVTVRILGVAARRRSDWLHALLEGAGAADQPS